MFAQTYFTDFSDNPSISNAEALGTLLCDVGEVIKTLALTPMPIRLDRITKMFDHDKQEENIDKLWIDIGGEG